MPFSNSYTQVIGTAMHRSALGALILIGLVFSAEARAAVDTSPPGAPLGVQVLQGEEWQPTSAFDVEWGNPVDQSSIEVAHYELCPAVPLGPCTTHQEASSGISSLTAVVPHAGWFWFRVWLEDAAGNVSSDHKSRGVMLRFDDQLPPKASVRHDRAWINAAAPADPTLIFEIEQSAVWPLSGIRGYSLTFDGSAPDGVIEAIASQDYERFSADYAIAGLVEGVTQLQVRSVSNAGLASSEARTVLLRVDRTAPEVSADVPQADVWHRERAILSLRGVDQFGLSGMAAAPNDQPLDHGAYLTYRLNDEPMNAVRGDEGSLAVSADGRHALTFQGFDAAGNPSEKKSVTFKIDRTAPGGVFRAGEASDPQRLVVDVFDATSGVDGGWIEYRREGAGGFTRLPTRLEGGRLSARVDDAALAPGRYAFRAVVRDVAGNEAVVGRRADGSAMELGLPVRERVQMTLGAEGSGKRCAKGKRNGAAKRKGRRSKVRAGAKCREPAPRAGATTLQLAAGKRATLVGRLTRGQAVPIAGADVTVEGQLRSGGAFVRLATTRPDAQGRLRFALPAGPSRTVRFRYEGSSTELPATAEVVTRVSAPVRLAVDRRRLVNGQSVRFTGQLPGKPIPSGGKLVALQARVGREWRTFATPRANARGTFKHRYRFTATTGVRRYAFRALVTREAAYPYETGASRKVRVTVRGR